MAKNIQKVPDIEVENARIIFRNFKGEADRFNAQGKRNFCLILDPDSATAMKEAGWNVKFLKPIQEGDDPTPYIKVNVSFKVYPPNVYLIAGRGGKQTKLTEQTIECIDTAEIETVDCAVAPYEWEPGRYSGYLRTMYVTIRPDPFAAKYANPNSEGDIPW